MTSCAFVISSGVEKVCKHYQLQSQPMFSTRLELTAARALSNQFSVTRSHPEQEMQKGIQFAPPLKIYRLPVWF